MGHRPRPHASRLADVVPDQARQAILITFSLSVSTFLGVKHNLGQCRFTSLKDYRQRLKKHNQLPLGLTQQT